MAKAQNSANAQNMANAQNTAKAAAPLPKSADNKNIAPAADQENPFSVRELALLCLLQTKSALPFPVILEHAYAKLAPSAHFSRRKAFLMSLCYGVLRHHGLLKSLYLPLCRQKPSPCMEYCLSLCLYELFFLQTEEHAGVNEYVSLLKKQEGQAKANALNAVLRNLLKQKDTATKKLESALQTVHAKIPANNVPNKKTLRKLHELADFPAVFTEETDKNFVQILTEESFCTPLPAYRINAARLSQTQQTDFIANLPQSAYIISPLLFADDSKQYAREEQDGLVSRQGVCSALLTEKIASFVAELDNQKKEYSLAKSTDGNAETDGFWDMCCGRGGKSLGLMEKNIPVSLVTEPNAQRLAYFCEQLKRLHLVKSDEIGRTNQTAPLPEIRQGTAQEGIQQTGWQQASIRQADRQQASIRQAGRQLAGRREFPFILLDSPCSTSGTTARNPEVKYRIDKEGLAEILTVQAELLELAHAHLQANGFLFYCTCSVFTRENKGQIKNFLAKFPDMRLVSEEYLHAGKINPLLKGHDILYFAVLQKQ